MVDSYPYILTNNKIDAILSKVRSAAKPSKFTYEFLKQLGFSSSNDRAIIPLLKKLGFISEDGTPTEYYDRLRDSTDWQFVLGERVKDLYKDLFNIDTEIHKKSDDEVKGAITRVTGKDEASVGRYFATFKALATLVKFGTSPKTARPSVSPKQEPEIKKTNLPQEYSDRLSFHHNIEIHLPATTDISVYNAIFKSLRENLLD
ncbi:MAG: DUF5343 domain-containing protein [Candidatus Thorarchaeota archaeon]